MSITANYVLSAVAIGKGASVIMDAWNLLLKRALGVPNPDSDMCHEAL